MVKGTFDTRLNTLLHNVGHGHLVGKVRVDQVYARYQHEGLDFKHPDGGQAQYLRQPLFAKVSSYMDTLANNLLGADGTMFATAMSRAMEDLSLEVYNLAPWEFGDLRASGNPIVTDDGAEVYNRPPLVARLSKDELRTKGELRDLFDPDRYK